MAALACVMSAWILNVSRMADTLASLEHGGTAVALLARLREMPGESRPLPFRRVLPKPEGA